MKKKTGYRVSIHDIKSVHAQQKYMKQSNSTIFTDFHLKMKARPSTMRKTTITIHIQTEKKWGIFLEQFI